MNYRNLALSVWLAGVLVLLSAAVAYLGWQVARAPRQSL